MLWLLPVATAGAEPAGSVVLAVSVHREAGSVYEIAADGAAGICAVEGATIRCPAIGPVTFRWGPGGAFALTGDTVLAPGATGTAAVWAAADPPGTERLRPEVATPEDVRAMFRRTGDHPVPVPSAAAFAALLALHDHPDPLVRREVIDALMPYWRHTASDPFPMEAPQVVPPGLLTALGHDPDPAVRRRLAARLRELRAPGDPLSTEATMLLLALAADGGGVQRAAFASLSVKAREGDVPAIEAWQAALDRVRTPGPPGRAAANTLAALATTLEPGPDVDPVQAVTATAAFQLERTWAVWKAWREEVPFDAVIAARMLRETVGMSPSLIKRWAADDPDGFAGLLAAWEPIAPHSDRYLAVVRAAGDNLSDKPDPAKPE
ncbi:MAG: hypothetical protein ABMB14_34530 [Myxococcota bacterium]